MKEKIDKAFSHKLNVFGKTIPTLAIAIAFLIGSGGAAVSVIVSQSATGDVQVQRGLDVDLTGTSGNIVDQEANSFEVSTEAGSTFDWSISKENIANEETEGLVETTVIDGGTEPVHAETLEEVTFHAVQNTLESEGSTVPKDTEITYSLTVDQQGNIDESSNGDYLYMNTADADDDGTEEAVICVANPSLSMDGMTFGANEQWDADYTVNTQNSFDNSQVDVTTELRTVYNPKTGSTSDVVKQCPQYPVTS